MLRKNCTTLWPNYGERYASSLGDCQRFKFDVDRSVGITAGWPTDGNVRNDVPGNIKFGIGQADSQPIECLIGVRPDDPQRDDMTLAGEDQRLPVGRSEFREENPISADGSAGQECPEQRGRRRGHGNSYHPPDSR